MRTIRAVVYVVRVTLAMLLVCTLLRAGPQESTSSKSDVDKSRQLTFEQEKAVANMRELEDRMIKLAAQLRELEPEESARLLLGVERARDELILDRMEQVTKLLDDLDLVAASNQQDEVLKRLQALKEVLLSADLSLQLKLDQIESILEAQQSIEQLNAKEQQQMAATKRAELAGNDSRSLQAEELRNQDSAEDLQHQIEKINGASKASESVGDAAASMGKASACLGAGDGSEAYRSQEIAVEQLQSANEKLEELKQQLQQQAENPSRTRVLELLKEMIKRQSEVKEATEAMLAPVALELTEAASEFQRLVIVEKAIIEAADECVELCEVTQFSLVLPDAMQDLRERMESVFDRLEASSADGSLVADEQTIIDDLNELLEAMEQGGKPGSPSNEKCKGKGPAGNRNKLIAEVRMLYWMQKIVKRKTRKIHEQRTDGTLAEQALKKHTLEMHRQQEKIRSITRRLRELTNPGYVNGDAI